jgi:hypothetical protein
MRKTVLALFIVVSLFTGIHAQQIECFVIAAPETHLTGVQRISILDFTGDKGKQLTDYFIAEMMDADRGIVSTAGTLFSGAKEGKTYQKGARTNVFSVVERSQLDNVLKEQHLSNSGIVDDAQAAEIGKILGIDAIIAGSVTFKSKDESSQSSMIDLSGKSYTSYCLKRIVSAEARMRVISVSTGQVICVANPKAEFYDKKCDDKRSSTMSAAALTDLCYKDLAFKCANAFSPYFRQVKIEFEKIKTKEFKDKSKQALEYIENGDFDKAVTIYKGILEADPYTAAAAFNLGSLFGITGNYEDAYQYFKTAAEIDEAAYGHYLKKAESDIEMSKILSAMGITIEKQGFESGAGAMADKIKTKGSKSDRYEVKEKADPGSPTIVKIPGDTEFTLISSEGKWYLIKLLGGKQGYLNESFVK